MAAREDKIQSIELNRVRLRDVTIQGVNYAASELQRNQQDL
jgi:hypothetical protein